jgi:hypothetical protein
VVLTDHNPRELPTPVREEGVLLVGGEESTTPFGHLVDVGGRRALVDAEKVSAPVRAAVDQGALAVIAHPRHSQRGWTDLPQARAVRGIEVWSGDSAWDALRRHPFTRLLPALGTALSNPERAMVFALAEAEPVADWMLQLDGGAGRSCGTDAHGWPGYATAFRWMSIHLTGLTAARAAGRGCAGPGPGAGRRTLLLRGGCAGPCRGLPGAPRRPPHLPGR